MRIALDYDDTFTADEQLWRRFVDAAKERGHYVAFVTSRRNDGDNADIEADAQLIGISIVYCNHRPKSECFKADVWIDDMPLTIPGNDAMLCMSIGRSDD